MEWAANELFPFMYFQVHLLLFMDLFIYLFFTDTHSGNTHTHPFTCSKGVCVCVGVCEFYTLATAYSVGVANA